MARLQCDISDDNFWKLKKKQPKRMGDVVDIALSNYFDSLDL